MAITELYLFTEDYKNYAFTSGRTAVTRSGITYEPVNISRNNLHFAHSTDKTGTSIKLVRTHSFAQYLIAGLSFSAITVQIIRGGNVIWRGLVSNVEVDNKYVNINCNNATNNTKQPGLVQCVSLTCRFNLYGADCTVVQESYKHTFLNQTISTNPFTVTGLGAADGYYTAGIAIINNYQRTILKQTGTSITLSSTFPSIQSGTLLLYPGCDLKYDTCISKFNNVINFGGFHKIPTKNPFGKGGLV